MIKTLIIENSQAWYELFNITIAENTKDQFEYTHVTDLKSALTKIEQEDFQLIIADLMLPDSHATNTIKTISKYTQPIIIITTLDDSTLIQYAATYGIETYIIKDEYNADYFIEICKKLGII